MDGFQEGYNFARKSSTVQYAITAGDQYVQSVDGEIDKLLQGMAAFAEINKSKPNKILGGDLAELWHEGTFNICAAVQIAAANGRKCGAQRPRCGISTAAMRNNSGRNAVFQRPFLLRG